MHGIPRRSRKLREGDIISVDVGCTLNGWVGDSAWTYGVGQINEDARRLLRVTEQCLMSAISNCRAGGRLYDLGSAVQGLAEAEDCSVVRDYVGHGVGQTMHEGPKIPNYVPRRTEMGAPRDMELRKGLVLAIEPMLCLGKYQTREMPDQWTVVTRDGKWCAHFEHTVALTENGAEILTTL